MACLLAHIWGIKEPDKARSNDTRFAIYVEASKEEVGDFKPSQTKAKATFAEVTKEDTKN